MVEFKNAGIRSNALDGVYRKTDVSSKKCLDIGVFCQGMAPEDSIKAPTEKAYHVRELPLLRKRFQFYIQVMVCVKELENSSFY